jgi:hypothetical protein
MYTYCNFQDKAHFRCIHMNSPHTGIHVHIQQRFGITYTTYNENVNIQTYFDMVSKTPR